MKKKPYIFGIICFSLLLLVWFKHQHQPLPYPSEKVTVKAMTVKEAAIPIQTHAVGALVSARNINIVSPVAGLIDKIYFQDGSFVKQGTPLIQLKDGVVAAKYASAKADCKLSETTFQRIEILAGKGIISKQDVEKAAADLTAKKAEVEESEVFWRQMLLTAPFDGVVSKAEVSIGEGVNAGQTLVSLTDVKHLRVEYGLSEKYFGLIHVGQTITLTTSAYPQQTFAGTVAYISPTINAQNRTISLYAEVPNVDNKLTAGLFVTVMQAMGMETNALLIPANSMIATIDGEQVYKIVDNKIQAVAVEVGQRTANDVQILKGLQKDDKIVIAGMQKVQEGSEVSVLND